MKVAICVAPSRSRRHAGRAVAVEEHLLARQRREAHHDVGLVLGAPLREEVVGLDRAHHAEVVAALLDRGDVDDEVVPHAVGDDRVARLVQRGRMTLPLDVLDVLGRAEVLQLLRLDDVAPRDRRRGRSRMATMSASLTRSLIVAPVAYGVIVASLSMSSGGELVLHLVEVALVRADAARLRRVADLVDAVDAAGPQQRLVEGLGHVRGHHHEDAVLGRRLRPHAERAPRVPVQEAARLLEPRQLGEQRLQRAHAAAATTAAHAHHEALAPGASAARGVDGMPARQHQVHRLVRTGTTSRGTTASGSNGPGVAIGPPIGPGWS